MAGMAIFPAVFALGAKPDAGPDLIFIVLPQVFSKMPGGSFLGPLFFLLLSIAALTSTVSLLEVVTAYFIDEKGWSRTKAVWSIGGVCLIFAVLAALSNNIVPGLTELPILKMSFFGLMETAFISYSLPIGAFFMSLFVGWKWGIGPALDEMRQGNPNFADRSLILWLSGQSSKAGGKAPEFTTASIWGIIIRFIVPVAIFILIVHSMNIAENYDKLLTISGILVGAAFLIWLSFLLFDRGAARFWKSFLPPVIRLLALTVLAPVLMLIPFIGNLLAILLAFGLNFFLIKNIFELDRPKTVKIFAGVSGVEIIILIIFLIVV